MNARALAVWCCATLLLASGCDQVGAALVADVPVPIPLPFTVCPEATECELPDAGVLPAVLPAAEVDVQRCGGIGPRDTELCDPVVPADAGVIEAPEDDVGPPDGAVPGDGVFGADDVGDVSAPVQDAVLPPCESAPHDRVPAQLQCADVSNRYAWLQDAADERVAKAEWRQSNLRFESQLPRTIAIDELVARDVWIELRGPVTLRVGREDGALFTWGTGPPEAGTEAIQDLRVTGVATADGAPQLVFEGVRARAVRIGDEASPFAGRVSARSSELLAVQLLADDVALESSRLDTGVLRARTFTAADAVLTALAVELEDALIARSELRASRVTRCSAVTLVSSSVLDSQVAACDAPSRMIDTRAIGAWLDGAIEGDGATFARVVFGAHAPTELVMWSGGMKNSAFCAGVESLAVAEVAAIECSMCESDTFVPDAVCELPESDVFLKNNLCPGLVKEAEFPLCPQPYPARHRADPRFSTEDEAAPLKP